MPKKGPWTVYRFKGGLARKRGVVFLRGVHTPMDTMSLLLCPCVRYLVWEVVFFSVPGEIEYSFFNFLFVIF